MGKGPAIHPAVGGAAPSGVPHTGADALVAAFDRLAARAGADDDSDRRGDAASVTLGGRTLRLFLVQGLSKSGTTWLGRLLNLHPEISCAWEMWLSRFFDQVDWVNSSRGPSVGWAEAPRAIARESLQQMARHMLASAALRKHAAHADGDSTEDWPTIRVVGDKTPGVPRAYLPGVPIIVAMRDGRDRLVSLLYHLVRQKQTALGTAADLGPQIASLHAVARDAGTDEAVAQALRDPAWARFAAEDFVASARAIERIRGSGVAPVLVVKYEAMSESPDVERDRVYDFLGVDPSLARPIDATEATRPGGGSLRGQNRFIRSGKPGDHRRFDAAVLSKTFEEVAGEAMEAHGYAA